MPTYEYRCDACGDQIEVIQSFADEALTICPHCGEAALRKLFGNVGVVFKGSGFYRNDARDEAKKAGAPEKDAAVKSDATPAKTPATPATTEKAAKPATGAAKTKPTTGSKTS